MSHIHRVHQPLRYGLVLIAFCTSLIATPRMSQAQFVVSDPTNLVQNTLSATSEITSAYQQIQAVKMQMKQLENQVKNLAKLRINNWQDFVNALNQVNAVIQRTKQIARMWAYQAQNFDRLWGKYGPPVVEEGPFQALKTQWKSITSDAAKHNLQTQADTAEANAANIEQLDELEDESEDVDGQLKATQLNTKTLTVLGAQQATLINLEVARANAEQTRELEAQRKADAARKRQLDALGGGFDKLEHHEPVILPDF